MQAQQNAYQDFMGQRGSDSAISAQLTKAQQELLIIVGDLAQVKAGTVPPTPTPIPPPTSVPTVAPTPTAKVIDPPRPMTLAAYQDLYSAPGFRGNGTRVCKGANVEVTEEQMVEGRLWYRIQIINTPTCGNGRAAGPSEWWIVQ